MKRCMVCERSQEDHSPFCAAAPSPSMVGLEPNRWIGGTVNGRYRLLATKGGASCGTLYVAEDLQTDRRVTVRVLPSPGGREPDPLAAFREAMSPVLGMPRTQPNIAAVYDFGSTADGLFFTVTDHVDGADLGQVLQREGALEISRALRFVLQIAGGLQAGHGIGLVHGDVRPQNICVVEAEDLLKVGDWDLAALRIARLVGFPAPVTAGRSFPYAAPELVEGRPVSERTDIYAVGAVLYEMLTGMVPPDGVVPSPGTLRREISRTLDEIVMQALHKRPERRQPNVASLVNAVAAELWFGRARPDGARPARAATDAWSSNGRWRREHRGWLLALSGAVLAAGVVAAAWQFYSGPSGRQAPAVAEPVGSVARDGLSVAPIQPSSRGEAAERLPGVSRQAAPAPPPVRPADGGRSGRAATQEVVERAREAPDDGAEHDARSPDPADIIDWLLKERGRASPKD